jgi:hypothetical protein
MIGDPAAFDQPTGQHAILIGHKVTPCNLMTWARWMEASSRESGGQRGATARHVGDDDAGGMRVSTIFIGLNHEFLGGPPLWFETMVFGGPLDGTQQRYTTWEQAEAGHAFILKIARGEAAIVREQVWAELDRIAAK